MLSASTLRPVFSVFLLQEETVIAAAAMTAAVRINLFIVLNVEIQKSYKDTQSHVNGNNMNCHFTYSLCHSFGRS